MPKTISVSFACCFVIYLLLPSFAFGGEKQSLVERLGYAKDARLLIINADDFGMCHSANMGTFQAFERGGVSSATIMVTCPWFIEAAQWLKKNPQYGVGLHTVLTSEWGVYKWGPVAGWGTVPSLCTDMGYFPRGILELYLQGAPEEVEKELRAQIDRALNAGIDLTHLDSHMGAAQLHPDYLAIYARLGHEFQLPCRMPSREALNKELGAGSVLDMFGELGVICPDELLRDSAPRVSEVEPFWKDRLSRLQPGYVTEIFIHCADDSPEMKVFTGSQGIRFAETEFFSNPATVQWIKDQGIIVISYRPLRDLQRGGNQRQRRAITTEWTGLKPECTTKITAGIEQSAMTGMFGAFAFIVVNITAQTWHQRTGQAQRQPSRRRIHLRRCT